MSGAAIHISPRDFLSWVDHNNKQHRKALLDAIHITTGLAKGLVKVRCGTVKPFPPINTGDYRNRWRHENTPKGGRVFNESPVAGIIELGVRPGRIPAPKKGKRGLVPMKPILRWCYLKFKVTQKFKQTKKAPRGKWVKSTVFKTENAAWGLAVAVQKKLNLKGIKAKLVLTHPAFVKKITELTTATIHRELAKVRA